MLLIDRSSTLEKIQFYDVVWSVSAERLDFGETLLEAGLKKNCFLFVKNPTNWFFSLKPWFCCCFFLCKIRLTQRCKSVPEIIRIENKSISFMTERYAHTGKNSLIDIKYLETKLFGLT